MTNFNDTIFQSFDLQSKVWIYTSSRVFTETETTEIEHFLTEFNQQWTSHGAKVKGLSLLVHQRFIIFIADENACGVGGCSIDKTVGAIRAIAEKYQVNLMDRFLITYKEATNYFTCSLADFKTKINDGLIPDNTIILNTTATSLAALKSWEMAYNQSPYLRIEAPISFGLL